MSAPQTHPSETTDAGFTFLEVLIAMSILVVGSVSVLGLFTLGVNRMVDRRVDARLIQVRPEIDSILQTLVDTSDPSKMPADVVKENAIPLSQRGYALTVTWKGNPFDGPQYWAQVQLLYTGKIVRLFSVPITRNFLTPKALQEGSDPN
jgi:prepilin-type N-terminal cleavage/methylation domain-containing protein